MRRGHTAQKRYSDEGSYLHCQGEGCDWVSPIGKERANRELHRQHRREMGEDVPDTPLLLEQHERIKYLRLAHTPHEALISYNAETGSTRRGQVCPVCRVPWPCLTQRLVDGDATAVKELEP
jgi:hypothetical protein